MPDGRPHAREVPRSVSGLFSIEIDHFVDHSGDPATIVVVSGDIDVTTAPEFEEALARAVQESGAPGLLIDLAQVRFVDSSGLNALVHAFERQRRLGGELGLVSVDSRVAMILEVSRLDRVLKTFPTREDALAALARG